MKLETVRIKCDGGHYAVVYKDKLRRTARLHEAELKKCMHVIETAGKPAIPDKVKLSELEAMETVPEADFIIDTTAIDNDAINEIFILNQVVEWSLDGPISRETIESGMPAAMYKKIIEEMDRLYKPVPLAGSAS